MDSQLLGLYPIPWLYPIHVGQSQSRWVIIWQRVYLIPTQRDLYFDLSWGCQLFLNDNRQIEIKCIPELFLLQEYFVWWHIEYRYLIPFPLGYVYLLQKGRGCKLYITSQKDPCRSFEPPVFLANACNNHNENRTRPPTIFLLFITTFTTPNYIQNGCSLWRSRWCYHRRWCCQAPQAC